MPDGRVVFVRHSLPGERVRALITAQTKSFVRADAIEVLEASPDRVSPPCDAAGPGRCGGCDFQHVRLDAQRTLKQSLVAEQLVRLAGVHWNGEVEAVDDGDGLGWRTRVKFAVDRTGAAGFHRHRSLELEHVSSCPLATPAVTAVEVPEHRWPGAHHVEVAASPDGGLPVVVVEAGRREVGLLPEVAAGVVAHGRTFREPTKVTMYVGPNRFDVSAGVFWQVHPAAPAVLTRAVLEGLDPQPGDRVADLYSGAGLFTVPLAHAVGPNGRVTAVERSARACADLSGNAAGLSQVRIECGDVTPEVVASLDAVDLVVLDPARSGAGIDVSRALASLSSRTRRIVYVSCDAASFARDLKVVMDGGWDLITFRAFDLFPMTEHSETVAVLERRPG